MNNINNNTNNGFINNQEYQYMRYLLREYTQHSRRTHELISSSVELLSQQDTRYYNLVNEFMRTIRNNSNQLREVNHYVHNDNDNDNDNHRNNENNRNNTRDNQRSSRDNSQSPLPQHMSREERIYTANRNRSRTISENRIRNRGRSTRRSILENTNTPIRRQLSLEPILYNNNPTILRRFPLRRETTETTTNTIRPINRSRLTNLFTRLYSVPEDHALNVDLQNLSPVHIRPTIEQINNATERLVFNTIENPTNSVCPITQQRFEDDEHVIRIIHCGHIYTSASLQQWFQRNTRCPLCRYDIRNYHPVRAIRNPYRRFTYDASNNGINNNTEDINDDNNNSEDNHEQNFNDDNSNDDDNNTIETNTENDADNEHSDHEELPYSSRLLSIVDPSTNEDIQSQLPDGVVENIRNLIGNDVNNYIQNNPLQVDNSGSMLFEYSFFFPIIEHDDEDSEADVSNNS